jgi:hypothetical protein
MVVDVSTVRSRIGMSAPYDGDGSAGQPFGEKISALSPKPLIKEDFFTPDRSGVYGPARKVPAPETRLTGQVFHDALK